MAATLTDRLREEILRSRFSPGERLVEQQLAEQYGESRAAVHIALIELEKEDLVVRTSNRGSTVRRISLSEAIEISEARAALEGLVAAQAARHATKSERQELLAIVKEMEDAVERNLPWVYSECNSRFHRRLQDVSRHTIASDLVRNLRNRGVTHQFQWALAPGRAHESLAEHARIVKAVASGNEDEARAAMEAHLGAVIATMRRYEELDIRL